MSEQSEQMTVDELARRARTTTRNIRNYQTIGLLPPPSLVGRVGYYHEGHLGRLRLIARLQEQGFTLAGIRELVQAWEQGRSLGDLLGFEQVLTSPWSVEEPEYLTAEELRAVAIDVLGSPALVDEAVALVVEVSYSDAEYALAKPERKAAACRRWIESPDPRVGAVKMADVEDNLATADSVSAAFGREYRSWAEPLYDALARKRSR